MKRILFILPLLFSIAYGQVLIPRAPSSVTVEDARFYSLYNFRLPVFTDTVQANLFKGIDSVGSMFSVRNTKWVMIRNLSTGTFHKWDTLNGVGVGGGGGAVYTADETTIHLAGTVFGIKSTYPGQSSIISVGNLQNGSLVAGFTPVSDALIASSATWNAKQSTALPSANLWVGNGSGIATAQSPTGDLTMTNGGVFTLASTIAGGSCTNCNLTYDAKGRITVAANGVGGGSGTPFPDNATLIKNNADNTKLIILGAANITTGTTRTLQSPDASGTIDLTSNIATLTNKTIAAGSNTITGLTNTNLSGSAGITNANLANSTISGVALGGTLFNHVAGFGLSGTNYNGAASFTWLVDTSLTHGPASKDYVNARMNGFIDPMTTAYDIIYRNGSNVLSRKGKGADGSVLGVQTGIVDYYTYNTYGVNGLHFNFAGDSIKLGGALLENTQISGAFGLDFSGLSSLKLTSGTTTTKTAVSTDSMMLRDNAGRVWVAAIPSGGAGLTASNGLNIVGSDVQLGGILTGSTVTINGSTTTELNVTGSTNTANGLFYVNNTLASGSNTAIKGTSIDGSGIAGTSTNGGGVVGTSTANSGVTGTSTSGGGGSFTSSSSYGVSGVSTTGLGGQFSTNPASTNTVVQIANFIRSSSGTAANGIGGSIDLSVKNLSGGSVIANSIQSILTDVSTPAYTSQLKLRGYLAGSVNTILTIEGDGMMTNTGGVARPLVKVSGTGTYTALGTDYTIEFTGSTATLAYPTVNLVNGRHLNIVNYGSGALTIPSTKTGNASTITTMASGVRVQVEYDLAGTTWIQVN